MRVARITTTGGADVFEIVETSDPEPGPGEAVVTAAAAGVNYIDIYRRSGHYTVDLPAVLGSEGAGTVTAVGAEVSQVAVGDRVAWAGVLGSYAERALVPAERLVPVPDEVALDVAAASLLQGMTAQYLTTSTFPLAAGDTVLIYAAAGGVGRLLVQMASRLGARVLACTSTDEKERIARELGADEVIRYRDVDVAQRVAELTDGAGVDVVYDSVGADTFEGSLRSLRPRGLLVVYGESSGAVPPIDLRELASHGSLFLTRPGLQAHIRSREELLTRSSAVFDLIAAGELDVHIHRRYPLEDVARSHVDLASGTTSGKLLLVP